MSLKKGLGRSFDSLLPSETISEEFDPTASQDEKLSQFRQLALDELLADPAQPRKQFDEESLAEMARSIKQHGILQPLVVAPTVNGYIIVAGERRWRAAGVAGLKKVPVLVRTLSDQHKLEVSLIENVQRRDLNPLETATAYLKLRDQFNLKLDEISQRVGGKSTAVISNTIRLLALPESAKHALLMRQISEGHARQILALETNASAQSTLLQRIIKDGWSVRRAEQFVIGYKLGKAGQKKTAAFSSTQTENDLTKNLSKRLGAPVKLKTTAKGGQLIINYKNQKDLERIEKLIS